MTTQTQAETGAARTSRSDELEALIAELAAQAPDPTLSCQQHRDEFEEGARAADAGAVTIPPVEAVGARPGEWLEPPEAGRPVVLYFRGGGHFSGSLNTARPVAARLAETAGLRVLVFDPRHAPDHPYPAQLEDSLAAYRWLLEEEGVDPAEVAFAGDSAGGGMLLATMLAARAAGVPLPRGGVLLSPCTDSSVSTIGPEVDNSRDPMVPLWLVHLAQDWYAGDADRTDPFLSPFYGDFAGLPPLLVQTGGAETLRPDAVATAERAAAAGVDVTLEVWPEMPHVWHNFFPRLAEAQHAFDHVAGWLHGLFGSEFASSSANVVTRLFTAMITGDTATTGALMSPDVRVDQPGSLPWGGRHLGLTAYVEDVIKRQESRWAATIADFAVLGALDEAVCVRIDVDFAARGSEETLQMRFLEIYRVIGGQVVSVEVFPADSQRLGEFWASCPAPEESPA